MRPRPNSWVIAVPWVPWAEQKSWKLRLLANAQQENRRELRANQRELVQNTPTQFYSEPSIPETLVSDLSPARRGGDRWLWFYHHPPWVLLRFRDFVYFNLRHAAPQGPQVTKWKIKNEYLKSFFLFSDILHVWNWRTHHFGDAIMFNK